MKTPLARPPRRRIRWPWLALAVFVVWFVGTALIAPHSNPLLRLLFLRNAGGLCFVQLSAGDGTKIQGMISKKEIGADSLKQFKQLVDLGDHLFIKGRVIASKTGELSVFATEWAIAAKALQPLPACRAAATRPPRRGWRPGPASATRSWRCSTARWPWSAPRTGAG